MEETTANDQAECSAPQNGVQQSSIMQDIAHEKDLKLYIRSSTAFILDNMTPSEVVPRMYQEDHVSKKIWEDIRAATGDYAQNQLLLDHIKSDEARECFLRALVDTSQLFIVKEIFEKGKEFWTSTCLKSCCSNVVIQRHGVFAI